MRLVCLCALALGVGRAGAADPSPPPNVFLAVGGDNVELPRDDLGPDEEAAIWARIQADLQRLRADGTLAAPDAAQTVFYGWPVRLAPGLTDSAGYFVSAFSDHNAASGAWQDYDGGTRTYDTHRGTDIALWPFSWNKLDAGDVQVVAAAAGTIVQRENITPADHNCGAGTGSLGNWIVLSHADGRITIYGHMKYNSLTAKGVGQTVALGEYLGTVGSAGNSSGPHVHFEARTALGGSELWTDPFTGSSNPIASGWLSQLPYYDSAINKIATATAFPQNEPCLPTVTHLEDRFPAAAHIAFQVYYRAYQGGLPTQLTVFNPAGGIYRSWSYTDNAYPFLAAAGRYWSMDLPADAPSGVWRFQAVYNGQTYGTPFWVNVPITPTLYLPDLYR